MFDKKSRYAQQPTQQMRDRRGRLVSAVLPPPAPEQSLLGYHPRKQGQRLDHMANRYLQDAQGFWRIAEFNDAMHADQIVELGEIAIPKEKR